MNVAARPGTRTSSRIANPLDLCALWYLALPNLIFLAAWLRPIYGIPAVLLLAAALVGLSVTPGRPVQKSNAAIWVIATVVAMAWLVLSGIGHLVYANSDWIVRDSVLNDLSSRPWPVQYTVRGEATPILLRAPIAYFLPAALLAKLVGVEVQDKLLLLWSFIGVLITFLMVAAGKKRASAALLLIVVFIFFSGLDIIGYLLFDSPPRLGAHLEWWATQFQYSSITTQMFWVPNHAIPAWIVTTWLLRHDHWRNISPPWLIVLIAITPLWSPLSAIGLAGLGVSVIGARLCSSDPAGLSWRARLRELFHPAALAAALVSLGLIAPYLLIANATVPGGFITAGHDVVGVAQKVAIFVLLEFGIYWILMWRRYRFDLLLTTAGISLLLLPWYRFGPGSDLTMRASIPALIVFAVRLGDWFTEHLIQPTGQVAGEDGFASLAMIAFVIGMATPFQEMVRPFLVAAEPVDWSRSVYSATGGDATHYLAKRQGRFADRVLAPGVVSGPVEIEIKTAPRQGATPHALSLP